MRGRELKQKRWVETGVGVLLNQGKRIESRAVGVESGAGRLLDSDRIGKEELGLKPILLKEAALKRG